MLWNFFEMDDYTFTFTEENYSEASKGKTHCSLARGMCVPWCCNWVTTKFRETFSTLVSACQVVVGTTPSMKE